MTIVIKNGLVFHSNNLLKADVLVEDDKIIAIGDDLTGDQVFDASGMLVSPGLIDMHVHYREPGQTYKEDIASGSLAAAHGGFTTVGAMPNVVPVPDTPNLMAKMVQDNQQKGLVHILQYGPLTKNEDTDEILDYKGLKEAGAFALSNDGKGVQSAQTMYLAMQKAKEVGLTVAAHAQDDTLFAKGAVNSGAAKKLHLQPINELAETTQIARDLLIAQSTGVHYHVCHVSTKTSVELIRIAKSKGINVTCEVTPHHLLLNETDIQPNDSNYKMNPPLRTKEDQKALIDGLIDGTIDIIATDHAPHAQKEKTNDLAKSAFGITGSETTFSELYTKFVKKGLFSLEQLLNWLSVNPAKIFSLKNIGVLEVDNCADIAVFDIEHCSPIRDKNYRSKAFNTPFTNDVVYGKTALTMVAGKIVYQRKETE